MTALSRLLNQPVLLVPIILIAGCANPYITITDMTDEITIPAPRESNQFISARVTGAKARNVYLAVFETGDPRTRVEFSRVGEQEYKLNLSDPALMELARRTDVTNGLRVFAEVEGGRTISSVLVRVKSMRPTLALPVNGKHFRLMQRESRDIPGSNGTLRLHIGDISAGAVLATMWDATGDSIIQDQVLRPGESVPFKLDGRRYVLGCERLINYLMGDDYGLFRVCTPVEWETRLINRLIRSIEESDALFVFSAEELSGPAFAVALRARLAEREPESPVFAKFLEMAAQSPANSAPCRVKTKDGATIDLATWWRYESRSPER